MHRRTIVLAAMGTAAMLATAGVRAQRGRTYRLAYLGIGTPDTAKPFVARLLQRLNELGYTEGKNLVFETRFARGDMSRLRSLAADLVAWNPDVLLAVHNPAVQAAKSATASIPIVMLFGGAPVEAGLVASLARPGANVTGLAYQAPETSVKTFEYLKGALPLVKKVFCLYEDERLFPGMDLYVQHSDGAARALGLTLILNPVASIADLERAFERVRTQQADALFVGGTGIVSLEAPRIIEFARRARLPAVYTWTGAVDGGGLMAYSGVLDHYRDGADYVDRILKGGKASEMPIELPKRYEFVVNMKVARTLGISIPQHMLLRADRLIE